MSKCIPFLALLLLVVLAASGCFIRNLFGPSRADRIEAAKGAVGDLQAGLFDEAGQRAAEVADKDDANPQARLVMAICRYRKAVHEIAADLRSIVVGVVGAGGINHRYMRFSQEQFDAALAKVDDDLAVAAADHQVFLELCPACWRIDWNQSGRIEDGDEHLFEVEVDADGNPIPDGDPRRRPSFRFDAGDVWWARAMVAFQRAVVNLGLAYRWTELNMLSGRGLPKSLADIGITIRLDDRARVLKARDLVIAGLDHADRARREYLAEADDDREWLPNPRQKDHPLPLPVDDKLYRTWEEVLADLRALVAGEEGIDLAEAARLGKRGHEDPAQGYLAVGRLFAEPGDIVVNLGHLLALEKHRTRADTERVLRDVFGDKYVKEMKPSPILKHLERMKKEIDRGEESLERKLRYLFWLN